MSQADVDFMRGRYTPGVRSGKIMFLEDQWKRMHPQLQEDFEPVLVDVGVTMYRLKACGEPYVGKSFDVSKLDPNDEYDQFKILVNDFILSLNEGHQVNMVDGDDDEEYTYGAFCVALTTCRLSESDWLITREYGSMYSIRSIISIEMEGET